MEFEDFVRFRKIISKVVGQVVKYLLLVSNIVVSKPWENADPNRGVPHQQAASQKKNSKTGEQKHTKQFEVKSSTFWIFIGCA